MLEDHGYLCTHLTQLLILQRCKILPLHNNRTGCRSLKEIQAANQRGFAGATHTDNSINLSLMNFQIDSFQCLDILILSGECLRHILNFNYCLHCTPHFCNSLALPVYFCRAEHLSHFILWPHQIPFSFT